MLKAWATGLPFQVNFGRSPGARQVSELEQKYDQPERH